MYLVIEMLLRRQKYCSSLGRVNLSCSYLVVFVILIYDVVRDD